MDTKLRLRKATLPDRLLERHRAGWFAFRALGAAVPAKEMPKAAFNACRCLIRKTGGGWKETSRWGGRDELIQKSA